MTDKYCPLRFREFGTQPHDQRCIGDYCAWFAKCNDGNASENDVTANEDAPNAEKPTLVDVDSLTRADAAQEPRETAQDVLYVLSREKLNAIRAKFGAGPTSMTDGQIEAMNEHYRPKKEVDMVIIDELHDEPNSREKLADALGATDAIEWSLEQLENANPALVNALKEPDSREKLEADVNKWCGMYAYQVDMVWAWLNRQAAITERECLESEGLLDKYLKRGEKIDDLQNLVDELRAEAVELRKENTALIEENGDLQVKLDEANDQVHELTAGTIEYDKALDAVKNDRDAWRERFEKANREKCDLQSSGVAQKFNNLCNRLRDKGIRISWDDSRSDYWVQLPHDIETISAERDRWRNNWTQRNIEYSELVDKMDELERERDYWKLQTDCWADKHQEMQADRDYWKRQYELICRAVEDVARNYTVIDEGMA